MYTFKDKINYVNFFRFDNDLVRRKRWASLPKSSKSIYPVVAVHCDANGKAFPSQETIAILSGTTSKTVRAGIQGLKKLPGFSVYKIATSRGHESSIYKITPTPEKKGRSFPLYKCVIEGGHWGQLSASAHALYIVMRTFSFFDGDLYSELEGTDYGYAIDALIEEGIYQKRRYDFVNAEISILAQYAGLCKSTVYSALNKMEKASLIEETYSIDGYDTFKIFRIPEESHQPRLLNDWVKERYGAA
jgi:hypothetical protein